MSYMLDPVNDTRRVRVCECCNKAPAKVKDYRNMYESSEAECVSSFRVCDECFRLADKEFWKTYNMEVK